VYQISRPKDLLKKRYSKSINMCSCKMLFTTTNFDSLPKIEFLFLPWIFLKWDHIYADNICAKFQVQKIYSKKDIRNLPTCVVVRKIFTTTNFNTFQGLKNYFFAIKFLAWAHLYVGNRSAKFQGQKIH